VAKAQLELKLANAIKRLFFKKTTLTTKGGPERTLVLLMGIAVLQTRT